MSVPRVKKTVEIGAVASPAVRTQVMREYADEDLPVCPAEGVLVDEICRMHRPDRRDTA
jgi:hypothetical protein